MSRQAQSLFNFTFSEQPKPRTHSTLMKSKAGSNDVVDALKFVHNGSKMVLISAEFRQTWKEYHVNPENSRIQNESNETICEFSEIDVVSMASELSVSHAIKVLDLPELRPDGVEPLLFAITLRGGENLLFIADSPRSCYIWTRALQALTESDQAVSMIPLMVSNRLRSGTLIYGGSSLMEDEEETVELKTVDDVECFSTKRGVRIPSVLAEEWQYFQNQIEAMDHFVQAFCILDSSQHLALLGDALRLQNMLNEIESLIHKMDKMGRPFHGWADWVEVHEKWWLLHAEIAVSQIRTIELREELGLKQA